MIGEMSYPWVFLKAAQMLRLAPERCLVVEAIASGAQGARDAGMATVCIGDAAEHGPGQYRLDGIRDLIRLLRIIS